MTHTKLYRETVLLLLFSVLSVLLAYVLRVYYARSFTPDQYGLFYAVVALVLIFGVVRNMGLGDAVTYFSAKNESVRAVLRVALWSQLFIGSVLFFALIAAAPLLSTHIFHDASATQIILFIGVAYLIVGFGEMFVAYFRGRQQNFLFGFAEPFRLALILIFSLLLCTFFERSLLSVSLAWVFAYVVFVAVYFLLYARSPAPKQRSESTVRTVYEYAVPSFFSTAGLLLFYNVDTLFITVLLGSYAAGLYNVSMPVANLLLMFSLPFSVILFPVISSQWKTKSRSLQRIVGAFYRYVFIACLSLAAVLLLIGKQLIVLFFGAAYVGAYPSLVVLLFAAVVRSIVEIQFSILAGMGHVRTRALLLFCALFLNGALNITCILLFGLVGAAVATLVSFIALFITTTVYLQKNKVEFPLAQFVTIVVVSAPFFAALYVTFTHLPELHLLALVLLGIGVCVLYFVWLLLWRVVQISEVKQLFTFIKQQTRHR